MEFLDNTQHELLPGRLESRQRHLALQEKRHGCTRGPNTCGVMQDGENHTQSNLQHASKDGSCRTLDPLTDGQEPNALTISLDGETPGHIIENSPIVLFGYIFSHSGQIRKDIMLWWWW